MPHERLECSHPFHREKTVQGRTLASSFACAHTVYRHWRIDMVKGLGTVIYHVTDLSRAKAWYSTAFQQKPYFDEPFYVGFNIAGYELGLDPNQTVTKAGRGG